MRQPKRRLVRGVCKWSGTVATMLLLAVWVGSAWRAAWAVSPSLNAEARYGRLSITLIKKARRNYSRAPAFGMSRPSPTPRIEWTFELRHWGDVRPYSTEVVIPLWATVLLTGLPTCWLWCHDRKQPGVCTSCGYDLRGADHAARPECGAVITSRATT